LNDGDHGSEGDRQSRPAKPRAYLWRIAFNVLESMGTEVC
jgi:hypothetical protein